MIKTFLFLIFFSLANKKFIKWCYQRKGVHTMWTEGIQGALSKLRNFNFVFYRLKCRNMFL